MREARAKILEQSIMLLGSLQILRSISDDFRFFAVQSADCLYILQLLGVLQNQGNHFTTALTYLAKSNILCDHIASC